MENGLTGEAGVTAQYHAVVANRQDIGFVTILVRRTEEGSVLVPATRHVHATSYHAPVRIWFNVPSLTKEE